MKKVLAVLMAVWIMISMAACGAQKGDNETVIAAAEPDAAAAQDAAKTIKVGIAAPDATHGWVAGVAYYAEKYCRENKLDYNVITNSDAAEMQTALQDLMLWGADIIVTYPQWEGMETAFAEVLERGIPVVNFDVEIDVDGLHIVTGDNYDIGYQSAKYIVEKVDDAAVIAVLDLPSAASVSKLRKQGFYDYLAEINYDTSNIFEIQESRFSREEGLADMSDILEAHDHVDAVYSMDDETSIGVVQAITEAGRKDIKAVTGGGGCQEYFNMINDAQYAHLGLSSALYSPSMIQDAIAAAIKLKNGEKLETKIVIPTTIVRAENVADYLDPDNNIY